MADHRIICTNQVPVNVPKTHAHIVSVGTGEPDQPPDRIWSLEEVVQAIEAGDATFFVEDDAGHRADVIAVDCAACGHKIIRTEPDQTKADNLDSLNTCPAPTTSTSRTTSTSGQTKPPATPRLPQGRQVG